MLRDVAGRVPSTACFTIMANCCHSGGIVESLKEIVGSSVVGPENYSEKIQEWLAKNKTTRPMATCFTACQSN
jgi:hypothetical protein